MIRLYQLTPLGYKALELMNNLSKEIDSDVIQYVETAKSIQDGSIHPFVKGLLYIGIAGIGIVFLASIGLFVMSVTRGSFGHHGDFHLPRDDGFHRSNTMGSYQCIEDSA